MDISSKEAQQIEIALTASRYKLKHYAKLMEKSNLYKGAQAEITGIIKEIDSARTVIHKGIFSGPHRQGC